MSLRRKFTNIILILTTIFTLSFPTVTLANTSPAVIRLAGFDRYETASQIAKSGWAQSDYAIIAFGENYPDALSSAPLAKKYNAPILLTTSSNLPSTTKQTLIDLQVKNVFLIGGTGVIYASVESEIQTMGINTTRIFGNDKYDTAIKVAQQITTTPSTIFVVTGEDYPDALSVASIASIKQVPIILVPNDSIPDSVKNYIFSINVSKTYVIGYSDIISDNVFKQFPNAERILGSDKYARNIAVNQLFNSDFKSENICVATGEGFADALTSTAYSAKISEPIILINNDSPTNTKGYYQQRLSNASNVYVFGGTGIIPDSVMQNLNTYNASNGDTVSPIGVRLNKSSITIGVRGSETLSATLDMPNVAGGQVAGNSNDVTWTSSNPAVATVSLGRVLGISPGTAVITVTTKDGSKTATCTVTVCDQYVNGNYITINLSHLTKTGATTATFKYQILDKTGTDITQSIPVSQISAVASINAPVSLNPSQGIGTITFKSPSDIDKPIIITLVDLESGIVVSLDSTSSSGTSSASGSPIPSTISSGTSSKNTDSKVSKITINSTKIGFDVPNDENLKIGYATFIVYDQHGNDITTSNLTKNLTFKTDVGTITIAIKGLLKIALNSNIDPTTLTSMIITGTDQATGVSTSATLTVIPHAMEIISQ